MLLSLRQYKRMPLGLMDSGASLVNVQAIKEMSVLICLSKLKSFMGMATVYTTFLPKLDTVAEPLHALEHKDVQFSWSSECQVAFEVIKDSISAHMQLALIDPCCPAHGHSTI